MIEPVTSVVRPTASVSARTGQLLADPVARFRPGRDGPRPCDITVEARGRAWLSAGSAVASALGAVVAPAAAEAEGNASGGALSPRRTWS